MTASDAIQLSGMVMNAMMFMLNSSVGRTGGVQDDAISTVGVVVQGVCARVCVWCVCVCVCVGVGGWVLWCKVCGCASMYINEMRYAQYDYITRDVMIVVIKEQFVNHMEKFKPFLIQGLTKIDEYQVFYVYYTCIHAHMYTHTHTHTRMHTRTRTHSV